MSSDRLSEAEHQSLLRLARGGQQQPPQQHRTDFDVLRDHFRFAWREGEEDESTWGARMAKRYVSKLFKEYALADLSRCKTGQVGLRWRVEREVIEGKGQFICGGIGCDARAGLGSWELPFTYREAGQAKTELVKVRLCARCKALLDRAQQARGREGGAGAGGGRDEGRRRPRPPPVAPLPSSSSSPMSLASSSLSPSLGPPAAKRAKEGGKGAGAAAGGGTRGRSSTPGVSSLPLTGGKAEKEVAAAVLARRREEAVQKARERRGKEMDELVAEILGGGGGDKGEGGREGESKDV